MASRFYFENTIVNLSGVTTIDSNWDTDSRDITQGIPGRTFKLIPAGTTPTGVTYSSPSGIPSLAGPLPRHTMQAMFEYTMPAGLLITGTVRGEFAGYRTNNLDNISHNLAVHIRNGTTHKATVAQVFTASNFYGFNPGNVQAMLSRAIVDDGYITVAGDVLYAELGLGWSATLQAVASVTVGYNNANSDWPDGADGTADTNPTIKNSWFEFETTLGAAPTADDFLPTLSATSVTARPSSPSKPGLHFFDRTTHIESIWDGTSWTNMLSGISGVTSGILGFSSTFGVSVTISGSTATWDAQALSVSGSRNRTLALTDDVTEGALLTAASFFGVNALGLKAPNSTNALRIGKYGNLSMAGTAVIDQTLLRFNKLDYNETGDTVRGMNASVTNLNIGAGGVAVQGLLFTASASMAGATVTTTNAVEGCRVVLSGGAAGNTLFQGSLLGYRVSSNVLLHSATGVTVTQVVDFQSSSSNTFTRTAVTERISFEAKGSITLLASAGLTQHIGFKCNALTAGNSRIGFMSDGMTTGTPTISYGFWSRLHAVGTTKRSFIGDNSFECVQNRMIVGTSGMGLVVADTVDGNYYQIFSANGFIQSTNLGASLPAS